MGSPLLLLPLLLAGGSAAHPFPAVGPRGGVERALNLERYQLQDLRVPPALEGAFSTRVLLDGEEVWLDLWPHGLRGERFELRVQDAQGTRVADAPAPATVRGVVRGRFGAQVFGSLRHGGLAAVVVEGDGRAFGVQPLAEVDPAAPVTRHVVYEASDGLWSDLVCGVRDVAPRAMGAGAPLPGTGLRLADIAFDSDVEFFQDNGSSVVQTLDDIESVLNGMDFIYRRDVGVTFELVSILVRTAEPDPYSSSSADTLLGQFQNEWLANQTHVRRDLAHLMTGRNLVGSTIGIAYTAGLCSSSVGYGLSERFTSNLTQRVALTSHEVGHNFSADHCNGDGDCRIMCASLGGCTGIIDSFGPSSIAAITGFAGLASCLIDLAPPIAPPFADAFPTQVIDQAKWTYSDGGSVVAGTSFPPSDPYALELSSDGPSVVEADQIRSNEILLGGRSGMKLFYYVQPAGCELGDVLNVEYLSSALDWQLLETVFADGSQPTFFELREIDLPGDAYHDRFRLRFLSVVDDPGDRWHLDSITVGELQVCKGPEPYGTPKTSSSGSEPKIAWFGQNSLAADDFSIFMQDAVPNQFAISFSGGGSAQLPYAGGFLWVQPPLERGPVQLTDLFGFVTRALPIDGTMVGTTRFYQWFFRDPAQPDGTGVGLSGGLEVPFCP